MLLSLVSAPTEGRRIGTLGDEAARRRFNVAASRARDQMFLFHTATLNDLGPTCLRHELLRYCQNPYVDASCVARTSIADLQRLEATADHDRVRPPDPFESWFEVLVFLRISARGYRVLPQYSLAGYFIDLVVEGMKNRIAVECDGDQWHGADRYEQDMARQRDLERCGMKFWRLRGSTFGRDPEGSLESLWDTLKHEGVYPEGFQQLPDTSGLESDLEPESEAPPEPQPELPREPSILTLVPRGNETPSQVTAEAAATPSRSTLPPLHQQAPSKYRDLADAPYVEWGSLMPLPDPSETTPDQLIPGIIDIVNTEGPMNTQLLYQTFVRGAGRHRVTRQVRNSLNRALARALKDRQLVGVDEVGESGLRDQILRKCGTRHVVVRPRGQRQLVGIPLSEIATLMLRIQQRRPSVAGKTLHRAVLDFYNTKRKTANILQRLKWIEGRRNVLAAEGDGSSIASG